MNARLVVRANKARICHLVMRADIPSRCPSWPRHAARRLVVTPHRRTCLLRWEERTHRKANRVQYRQEDLHQDKIRRGSRKQ